MKLACVCHLALPNAINNVKGRNLMKQDMLSLLSIRKDNFAHVILCGILCGRICDLRFNFIS